MQMYSTAPSHYSMEHESLGHARWQYNTSDARSEPLPTPRKPPTIVRPSPQPPSPPLAYTAPPPPVKIIDGVWRDGDNYLRSSDLPEVQDYLKEARKNNKLGRAPSEVVFALAALDVIYNLDDNVHWLFWKKPVYKCTADIVTKIALHQPRLIKTNVPWIGTTEYRSIVHSFQEKYLNVYVKRQWYPTDPSAQSEPRKRMLRSSDRAADQTVNDLTNLPDGDEPPRKRARRSVKKVVESQTSPTVERVKRTKVAEPTAEASTSTSTSTSPTLVDISSESSDLPTVPKKDTPTGPRVSTRVRRKTSPSKKAPRITILPDEPSPPTVDTDLQAQSSSSSSTTPTLPDPIPSPSSPSSSTALSHSRNRSTSQSSAETLVEEGVQRRSASVISADTAVEKSSPKKRKAEVIEELDQPENVDKPESSPPEGMVTRGRASKIRLVDAVACPNSVTSSSRANTPATKEALTKSTKPRPRAKRAKVC
ncbi:hypothetical protein B0H34DRAFT_673211 [Crassisporium funariophilum]|nr:hypothetical protein B0H34DRAFT_673211 [Crassisporium funariophilum]